MIINVLSIGDTANVFGILKKYVKDSKITILHSSTKNYNKMYPVTESDVTFTTSNILKKIEQVKLLKGDFDLFVVSSWEGALIAYLCGLNYIFYILGTTIRAPTFVKDSNLILPRDSVYKYNWLERVFYKKILDEAISCVVYSGELYPMAKKYRQDVIRMDRLGVDERVFELKEYSREINKLKEKFTFFCPQRIDLQKGTDIIWKAVELCKSDFEIIQVEWYQSESAKDTPEIKQLMSNIPKKVKLIPLVNNKEIKKYYDFVDAVIGQVGLGSSGMIEREAVFCKKPVINYTYPDYFIIDGKKIESPFLPKSNDPKSVAKIIDQMVESKKFREELLKKEYEFVKEIADPKKWAKEWDEIFKDAKMKSLNKKTITKNRLILRKFLFILGKLFHFTRVKQYYLLHNE